MNHLLKWPLIVAAVVVVSRVVAERTGASPAVTDILGVWALHVLLAPLYFAVKIARSPSGRPYWTLIRLVAINAVLVRAMVIPTYWLARIYEWPEPRFQGLAGPDVTPLTGFVLVPFATAASWIVSSMVVGSLIGALVIAIMRRLSPAPASAR